MDSLFEENDDDETFMSWTPKLKNCCFMSLETGTKFIGYFQMVFYGMLSLLTLYDGFIVAGLKNNSFFYIPKFLGLSHLPKSLFGCLLPLGIHKGKRGYHLGWLLVTQLMLLENIIIFIIDMRFTYYIDAIIFNCIDIRIYFLLVVHSYYCSGLYSNTSTDYPQQT